MFQRFFPIQMFSTKGMKMATITFFKEFVSDFSPEALNEGCLMKSLK